MCLKVLVGKYFLSIFPAFPGRVERMRAAILACLPVGATLYLLAAVAVGSSSSAPSGASSANTFSTGPTEDPRILFVGDSFTSSQGGIYSHLVKLAQPTPVVADHVTVGGATLRQLWTLGDAVRAIDTHSYDVVVLQDDIPETNVDYFREFARMFIDEARKHHARPILYMTWAYDRLGWISMQQIADAHRDLARETRVEVAPVGLAWELARKERPSIELFAADREHPNPYGMYLATCVMYATIFGKDPAGLTYVPEGVTPSDAAFLQRVAAQTVNPWRNTM
jgi:hypothetical protein